MEVLCLISVGWFTRARDMEVTFTKEAVDLSHKGVVVSQGIYDEGLGMLELVAVHCSRGTSMASARRSLLRMLVARSQALWM